MATFECKVYKLRIEEHPNADALELAVVGDYRSIVRKGQFKTGDLGVYIPEAAIVPDWLIAELGLEGRLAGKQKNRVKAVKLRGILSQGLVYPVLEESDAYRLNGEADAYKEVYVGEDVTEFLGITKYEPVIPTCMNGEVWNAFGLTLKYDIENFKKYPTVLKEGEDLVTFTEKLHGTWACFGYHPDSDIPIVTSKGLSDRGVAFKFNEANANNLYVTAFQRLTYRDVNESPLFKDQVGTTILDRVARVLKGANLLQDPVPFYVLGEIFGQGVQDLTYGTNEKTFRVFDIYVGQPGQGKYLNANDVSAACALVDGVEYVPVLYSGVFTKAVMDQYTDGMETVSGTEACIREGIVVRLQEERTDVELGRVILKSVSEAYLLRKGNVTEFN